MPVPRPRLNNPILDALSALISAANENGIDVSTSKFAGAKFARDFFWIALLLLPYFPKLSERLMFQLAREVSLVYDEEAELAPGKVPHEVRKDVLDGIVVPPEALNVIREMGPLWGGNEREFKIGYAADSTALFIKLVAKIDHLNLEKTGQSILDSYVDHVSGEQILLRDLVALSVGWVEREVETSLAEDGFAQLGWTRKNPHAHPFQILEDGAEYGVDPETGQLISANSRLYALPHLG